MIYAAFWTLLAVAWFAMWRVEVRENERIRERNAFMAQNAWYLPRSVRETKITFACACAYLAVGIVYFVQAVS